MSVDGRKVIEGDQAIVLSLEMMHAIVISIEFGKNEVCKVHLALISVTTEEEGIWSDFPVDHPLTMHFPDVAD